MKTENDTNVIGLNMVQSNCYALFEQLYKAECALEDTLYTSLSTSGILAEVEPTPSDKIAAINQMIGTATTRLANLTSRIQART